MLTPPHRLLLRASALVLASTLALAGCVGTDDAPAADAPAADTSPQPATPSESVPDDVDLPAGVELTEPGAQLSFGDAARVAHEAARPARDGGKDRRATRTTVLALTVDSATRGSVKDLAGFRLTDPYQRRAHYYYVRVTVRNLGEKRFGDVAVPLWGISGENTLLPPVQFTSAFARCPTEPLPVGFRPGARFRTCLVFLSPDKGSLEGVSYRPTEKFTPIEWRGRVSGSPRVRSGSGD